MRGFISAVGRIWPRLRTIERFAEIYDVLLSAQPLNKKTLHQRRYRIRLLIQHFPGRLIAGIQPHELAELVRVIHASSPTTARGFLREARGFFGAAQVQYGWIKRNPAAGITPLPVSVKRNRLTLDQWRRMHAAAVDLRTPWVLCMLELALVSGQRRADLQKMRETDIWPENGLGDYLHVAQQKTGAMVALPITLRLDVVGLSLGEVIEKCREYGKSGETLLRKSTGLPLSAASLSFAFEDLFRETNGGWRGPGNPPSLHECRSLAERLYREQGIDTRTLLGHKRQSMTDVYNDDRGLSAGSWKLLELGG